MIVSTTRDVDEELAAGRLIPELRRALPQTLDLAPLRARLDDLPALAPHILRRQAEQAGRTVPIISDASLERLKGYRWPGNLRELRNVLGAALAASQGPILEIGDHLLDNGVRVGSYSLIERSDRAAWARSGWRAISCWPGRRRSRSCASRRSAPARTGTPCASASRARRRRRRSSSRRTPCSCSTSA